MRTRHAVSVILALAVPALALLPAVVSAADDAKPGADASAPDGKRRTDPENVTGISPFMELCVQGNAKYVAKDIPGATEIFRKAVQNSPKHPLGHYLLGEALLAAGNLAEAEASWKQAEAAGGDPLTHARVLFVLADVKERQKKWEEARQAWIAYQEVAVKLHDAGAGVFPSSAQSRLQAIENAVKQDKDYEAVRKRIKDTADGGVFTSVDAAADAKK